jgi:hypothetical protein
MKEREKTFVIPHETPLSLSVQQTDTSGETYTAHLAAALRMKVTELSWLFIEAEGRRALAREWTAEAREAGEPNWNRYLEDIEILEAALKDAQAILEQVGKL